MGREGEKLKQNPLILAAQRGWPEDLEKIRALSEDPESSFSPNEKLPSGLTPLLLALENAHPEAALALLKNYEGRILTTTFAQKKITPLHLALEYGYEEVSASLIKQGASVTSKRETDGFSPFHVAVKKGQVIRARQMLDKASETPIAAESLLNFALENGQTPLHLAVESGQIEMVRWLVESEWAVRRAPDLAPDLTPEITKAGLFIKSINQKDSGGETPLMRAIFLRQQEIGEYLVSHSDLAIKNSRGESVLVMAAKFQAWKVVEACLSQYAVEGISTEKAYLEELIKQGKYLRYMAHEQSPLSSTSMRALGIPLFIPNGGHVLGKGGVQVFMNPADLLLPRREISRSAIGDEVRMGQERRVISNSNSNSNSNSIENFFALAVEYRQPLFMAHFMSLPQFRPQPQLRRDWIRIDDLSAMPNIPTVSRSKPSRSGGREVESHLNATEELFADFYFAAEQGARRSFFALYEEICRSGLKENIDQGLLFLNILLSGRTALFDWALKQYPFMASSGFDFTESLGALKKRNPSLMLQNLSNIWEGNFGLTEMAVQLNRVDWVEKLLKSGADPSGIIREAVQLRSIVLIESLVDFALRAKERGNPQFLSNIEGCGAQDALRLALTGEPQCIETILKYHPLKHFGVSLPPFAGYWDYKQELLKIACQAGNLEWIDRLLEAGASLDKPAYGPSYPLSVATWRNDRALSEALLARGANPMIALHQNQGVPYTLAHQVAEHGYEDIRELFMEKGMLPEGVRHQKHPNLAYFKARKAQIMEALEASDASKFELALKHFDLSNNGYPWKGVLFESRLPEFKNIREPLIYWVKIHDARWALPLLCKLHETYTPPYWTHGKFYDHQKTQLCIPDSNGNTLLHRIFMDTEENAKAWWEALKAVQYFNKNKDLKDFEEIHWEWLCSAGGGLSAQFFSQNHAGMTPVELAFAQGWEWLLKDPAFYRRRSIEDGEAKPVFLQGGPFGRSVLHYAVLHGTVAILSEYLDVLPDQINHADFLKVSPLMLAAGLGDLRKVKLLRERGANIECRDKDRQNFLHYAAKNLTPSVEVIFAELMTECPNAVLRAKADFSATPLWAVIKQGWAVSAERLLDRLGKTELLRRSRQGWTLLHWFAVTLNEFSVRMFDQWAPEIIQRLAREKSHIDVGIRPKHEVFGLKEQEGLTPLMLAGLKGNVQIFERLLALGADPLKQVGGRNALDHAMSAGSLELTEKICRLPQMAQENIPERLWFMAVISGNQIMLTQLLLAGFFINQLDEAIAHGDENALHYAARAGHTSVTALLLGAGIDRELKNLKGETPRILAEKAEHFGVLHLLDVS